MRWFRKGKIPVPLMILWQGWRCAQIAIPQMAYDYKVLRGTVPPDTDLTKNLKCKFATRRGAPAFEHDLWAEQVNFLHYLANWLKFDNNLRLGMYKLKS